MLRPENDRLELELSEPDAFSSAYKADDYDIKSRTMGKYLLEVGMLEWHLLATPPSRVAAAAIWLSRPILGNDKWVRDICLLHLDHVNNTIGSQTADLAHYSLYADIQTCPEAQSNALNAFVGVRSPRFIPPA